MRSRCYLTCAALLALSLPLPAMGQFLRSENLPTSAPSAPTSPSMSELRHWVVDLGDDDADTREAARSALLGLRREDLPALKAALVAEAPLLPAQFLALHEIVRQAYLASDTFESEGSGFLGLHWPDNFADGYGVHDVGLVVVELVPGFCAYRMLRPGDVILKLLDDPEIDVRDMMKFTNSVKDKRAGQKLRLAVLRQNAVIEVDIVLDPRPLVLTPAQMQQRPDMYAVWERDRTQRAEQYWAQQFNSFVPAGLESLGNLGAATQPEENTHE